MIRNLWFGRHEDVADDLRYEVPGELEAPAGVDVVHRAVLAGQIEAPRNGERREEGGRAPGLDQQDGVHLRRIVGVLRGTRVAIDADEGGMRRRRSPEPE